MTSTVADRIDTSAEPAPTARVGVLLTAMFGFFLISLDASVVNVALPAVGSAFGSGTASLQWIVDAYTLMLAAFLLSAGAVSDRLGADRVYRVGIAVFTAASAVCAVAPGLGVLVGARLVQGTAAAVMLPSSLALIRQAYTDPHKRSRAIALWAVAGTVALAAGPAAGGALTALSWRWIFLVNVPVGVLALGLLTRAEPSPRRKAALDPWGQLSAVLALTTLTFAVIEGGSRGFGTPPVIGCLIAAAVAMGAFALIESRVADPMVPPALVRSATVMLCVSIGFALNMVFYGMFFLISLFVQQAQHRSALQAGLVFVPMALVIACTNLLSARSANRWGAHVPITAGLVIGLGGTFGLLSTGAHTSLAVLAALLAPMGGGLGLVVPALTACLLADLPAERAGLAAGVLNSARQTGGAMAVAGAGALLGGSVSGGFHRALLVAAVLLIGTIGAALGLCASARTRGRRAAPAPVRRGPAPVVVGELAGEQAVVGVSQQLGDLADRK